MHRSFRTGQTLRAADLRDAIPQSIRGGPGITVKNGPSGVTISATGGPKRGGAAAAPVVCDFILTTRVDTGIYYAKLTVGAPNGVPPNNIFSEITYSISGTEYVILTGDAPSGYVVDWTWDIVGTAPDPIGVVALNGPPTAVAILLYVISDGVAYRVAPCTVPSVEPVFAFSTPRTGVTDPVEPRYDDWWAWGYSA